MRPVIGITCGLTASKIGGNSPYFSQYNIISCDYAQAIEHSGGVPMFLPHTESLELADDYLSSIDGILLSGGGDIDPLVFGEEPHPQIGNVDVVRDRMELSLLEKALNQDIPILGICRGIQMLAVASGGNICQDIASEKTDSKVCHSQKGAGWYASHTIEIQPDTMLHNIFETTTDRVNSFHHQAVNEVGRNFVVAARAKDGVIEAIESSTHRFAIGVQFHSELMWKRHPPTQKLFAHFVKVCQSRDYYDEES